MRRFVCAVVFAVLLVPSHYVFAATAMDEVKLNAKDVLDILGDPKLKGDAGKKVKEQKIEAAAERMFDFVELSKRALAMNWNRFTPDQRREFVGLFKGILKDAYIDKITAYTGEKVSFTKEIPLSENTVEILSSVEMKTGTVPINYRVIKRGDGWKVYDVVIEGVSLVNNYRNQFREILGNNPPEKLLETLRKKVEKK